jgi:hypothetical protein
VRAGDDEHGSPVVEAAVGGDACTASLRRLDDHDDVGENEDWTKVVPALGEP